MSAGTTLANLGDHKGTVNVKQTRSESLTLVIRRLCSND